MVPMKVCETPGKINNSAITNTAASRHLFRPVPDRRRQPQPLHRRETSRTRRDSISGLSDIVSSVMAACSSWWRRPDPVAGLALSGRPT